jgi:hypothetical protein
LKPHSERRLKSPSPPTTSLSNRSSRRTVLASAHRERRAFDHHDRPPHVEQHVPALEPPLGFLGRQQVAGEIGHRPRAVVDVRAMRGLVVPVRAGGVGADDRAEADHLVGPGQPLHQRLGLALVALELAASEIGHIGRLVGQHEAVAVERQPVGDRPHVVDRHRVLVDRPVALRAGRRRGTSPSRRARRTSSWSGHRRRSVRPGSRHHS